MGNLGKLIRSLVCRHFLLTVMTDRRIMDRLSSIYNGYESVLFKDKLIFKPADSHGNGLMDRLAPTG